MSDAEWNEYLCQLAMIETYEQYKPILEQEENEQQ